MKIAAKVCQDYYPEILGVMYVLNMPWIVRGVWGIVKGFVDEKTRKKINLLGADY
jgi:hypothetical protein